MEKLAVGKNIESGTVDLGFPLEKNLKNLSHFRNKQISDLTACILDRPRHKEIINKLKQLRPSL